MYVCMYVCMYFAWHVFTLPKKFLTIGYDKVEINVRELKS